MRPASAMALSPPEARVQSASPTSPKRSHTRPRPSARKSAHVWTPSPVNSSMASAALSVIGTGTAHRARCSGMRPRNDRLSSVGTMRPSRAASRDATGPSAMPTKHSTPTASSITDTRAKAAASSLPCQRAGPRARHLATPGRTHSTPAATESKASTTAPNALASRSGSRGKQTRSGHTYVASRMLMPLLTPARRAASLATSTRSLCTTAPAPPSGRSTTRQWTGQSGTHTTMSRT